VFRESGTLLNPESFRGWLFRIARNETLMHLRRNRETELSDPDGIWEADTPLSIMEKTEERIIVQTLLSTLKKEYREVLHLREYQQLSYAEIARITGATESSVKSRIFKARQALAQKLAPWFRERTQQ
jgi:RNA polymerase sigma-70 factor (ECF subfamily)